MTSCNYEDRIEVEDGKLVRVVKATSRSKKQSVRTLDVYKEYEDGKTVCRNLYRGYCGGYYVGFPNDQEKYYGRTYTMDLQDWDDCGKLNVCLSRPLSEQEKALVVGAYPEFRYVLKKWEGGIEKTMAALALWQEHKEIELVLARGFQSVALNKNFWKLTEKKRKGIALFMRRNPDLKNLSLIDIQTIMSKGLNAEEWQQYKDFCHQCGKMAYDEYKYLVKIGKANARGKFLYRDYQNLLSQTPHDSGDTYWKYPSDLQARHDRLMEEVRRIRDLEKREKIARQQEAYFKAVEKFLSVKIEDEGYTVYVPDTVEDIKLQADKLHQCLVTCDYISQVASGECILVFVRKDGNPVATAQIMRNGSIGQFYTDELDRNDCLPTEDVRRAVDGWLKLEKSSRRNRKVA